MNELDGLREHGLIHTNRKLQRIPDLQNMTYICLESAVAYTRNTQATDLGELGYHPTPRYWEILMTQRIQPLTF